VVCDSDMYGFELSEDDCILSSGLCIFCTSHQLATLILPNAGMDCSKNVKSLENMKPAGTDQNSFILQLAHKSEFQLIHFYKHAATEGLSMKSN